MLIIFEGCDGAGKTRMAKEVAEIIDAKYVHFSSDIASNPEAFKIFSDLIEASKTNNIVCDRFCYGQFVYQNQSERVLDFRDLTMLEKKMSEAGVKRILVESHPDLIKNRLYKRGGDAYFESTGLTVEEVMQRFENVTICRDFSSWKIMRGDKI
jgi:thymidylate kinase